MWYNRSGSLIQAGSLLDLFNNPRVHNSLTALAVFASIWVAVPAPKHDENKPLSIKEEGAASVTAIDPAQTPPEPGHH